jgi:hypothetical protein
MTLFGRVALGALFGVLIASLLHPVARSTLLSPIYPSPRIDLVTALNLRPLELKDPTNRDESALWLRLAAERLMTGETLSKNEAKSIERIATRASELEPDNAFWRQVAAAMFWIQGLPEESKRWWLRASNCLYWNDYQRPYLDDRRNTLADLAVGASGWQIAYLYQQRSNAVPLLIQFTTIKMLQTTTLESENDLRFRYATMRNGALLRDGARSVFGARIGIEIVEKASHPPDLARDATYRRLYAARIAFRNTAAKLRLEDEAKRIDEEFRNNDGWSALMFRNEADALPKQFARYSVLLTSLPGSLLLAGVLGITFWGIGSVWRSRISPETQVHLGVSILLGLGVAGAALAWLENVPTAVAAFLSVSFVAVSPKLARKQLPPTLGPLFFTMCLVFSIVIASCCALAIGGQTLASRSVLPIMDLGLELMVQNQSGWALALLGGCSILVLAPLWAFAQRIPTLYVVASAMQTMGAMIMVVSISAGILLAPVAAALDQQIERPFSNLLDNESAYYINQR